jgi:phospholipid/cholesterol/gamma-HCH transport system substrate-binding protein
MVVKAVQDFSELAHVMRDPEGPIFRILTDFGTTIGHVEKVARELQAGRGTAGSLLKSNQLVNSIHANLNKVGAILDHIESAAATLPQKSTRIDGILEHIHGAAAKTPAAMDQVQENLETVQAVGEGVLENITQLKTILAEVKENLEAFKVILNNMEKASFDVPKVTRSTTEGIKEIRESVENIDQVVKSLQQNFLIRSNLPPLRRQEYRCGLESRPACFAAKFCRRTIIAN